MEDYEEDDEILECDSILEDDHIMEYDVYLPYNTPVVGFEITPRVQIAGGDSSHDWPSHPMVFKWYRELITCSVHCTEIATIQCSTCVTLKLPVKESYHCSTKCFLDAWNKHFACHHHAAKTMRNIEIRDVSAMRKAKTCGSCPLFNIDSSIDKSLILVEREGKAWIEVGSSETYVPSRDDFGFTLRLEYVAVYSRGVPLSLENFIVTDPVILAPSPSRSMIQIGPSVSLKTKSSGASTFSVLSYNVRSSMWTREDDYSSCPAWALTWEYRRQNLLREIIGYNADILCLQEVESNHFEDFYKPELAKCGYSAYYKKKKEEMLVGEHYVIGGCATFYRCARIKYMFDYEIEIDEKPLWDMLQPSQKTEDRKCMLKDSVVIALIFKILANDEDSTVCVANTLMVNLSYPDVILHQVAIANLIQKLVTIVNIWKSSLLICGGMESLPGSDPHSFLVTGMLNLIQEKSVGSLDVYRHPQKLYNSMCLVSAYSSLLRSERVNEREKQKMNFMTREPLFTNIAPDFSGTLDYIFYTDDSLKVESLLQLLDNETDIPSPLWSSDHIALMANFSFKPVPANIKSLLLWNLAKYDDFFRALVSTWNVS